MHISQFVSFALITSLVHATPLRTVDAPLSADTHAAWDRAVATMGFVLSKEELGDFFAAEVAIAEALGTGAHGTGSVPFLHGMSIRQIILLGLALEKRECETRVQELDASTSDIALLSPPTTDAKKLAERKEVAAAIAAQQKRDRERIATIESRVSYWKKRPNKAPATVFTEQGKSSDF